MSKGVFINSLNTYIGTALYEEFVGLNLDEPESEIYSTYFEKEDSTKPKNIKKMMKQKTKPGLFRKYMLEKFNILIYDLHCGKLEDLKFCIKSLTKSPLEEEKTVVVISSVLTWGNTEHKLIEDKPEEDNENNEEENNNFNKENKDPLSNILDKLNDEEKLNFENYLNNDLAFDEEGNEIEIINEDGNILTNEDNEYSLKLKEFKIKLKISKLNQVVEKEIKYKRVGYTEEEYLKRVPIEFFKSVKEYEDEILNLKIENLNIYVICSGIPYGNAESIFNYHFKSAWLQDPKELPYIDTGENIIPTIHVKDLCKIIKMVLDKKPESKYIFAFDNTKDKRSKTLVSSISNSLGSGKTVSISSKDTFLENYNFDKKGDVYVDHSNMYSTKKINLIITENELNWHLYFKIDAMLSNTSLYDQEEFEYHCKDFNNSLSTLIKEFVLYRHLRPLKIVLNCEDNYMRSMFAEMISKAYNVPIINTNTITNMLSLNKKDLNEEELIIYKKYLDLISCLDDFKNNGYYENDPEYDEEEVIYETLRNILIDNMCRYRGYVLEGISENTKDVNNIYYERQELKNEDNQDEIEEENNEEENKDDENINEENIAENKDNSKLEDLTNKVEEINNKENSNLENEEKDEDNEKIEEEDNRSDVNSTENSKKRKIKDQTEEESIFVDKQDEIDKELKYNEINNNIEKSKKNKKIKIKEFKKIFLKNLLPESVITIGCCLGKKFNKNKNNLTNTKNEVINNYREVESFYQNNKIEVCNIINSKDKDEMFECMRIYIERNGRPFNYYLDNEDKIHYKRETLIKTKLDNEIKDKNVRLKKEEDNKKQEEDEFWRKMEDRIKDIKENKSKIDEIKDEKTRKFLLLNIMPILTNAMLDVCKVDPIDPIDYLANYLFNNSTS